MGFMFFRNYLFDLWNLSNWDTINVTNMRRMFYFATSFDQNLGAWDIGKVTTMEEMFVAAELSTTNYDNTLIGWATDSSGTPGDGMDDIPINITFDGGNSTYCAGEAARALLIAAGPAPTGYGWTISDGGQACPPFITKWVVGAGETITIPTTGSGYDYNVDWSYDAGDGFNAESMQSNGQCHQSAIDCR